MIGNDIVDLSLAAKQSKWEHPRFLNKLFTESEQAWINSSSNPFSAIWELWASKEAAYKAYLQLNPGRFFNPRGFECSTREATRYVRYRDFKVQVTWFSNEQFVYTETITKQPTQSACFKCSANESENHSHALRQALYAEVAQSLSIPKDILKLEKAADGIPRLYAGAVELETEVSLTHHGSWAAYSISYL
jgi:phosphopantetheinyl transferase (holo-ACP synthase)